MTKHEKRLQRARNNPKAVSYNDFVSILENEGYTIRMGKGSHRKAERMVGDAKFSITFVEPHGKRKTMHKQATLRLLTQLDEIKMLEEDEENE